MIPHSVIRPPAPSHPYYLRSRNKDQPNRGGIEEEQGNTEVLGDNFSRTYYFKRCQRKRLARIESLPDDLLFEILVHLPAQDIYEHARFVCRKWYRMIHTRKFLCEHFKHVTYGILMYVDCWSLFFMTEQQGRIEISRLNYKLYSVWLSCNGLFLEVECHKLCTVRVVNPVTKQKLILPPPPLRFSVIYPPMYGIACSAVSMEYKVVFVEFSCRGPTVCFILTVGVDESWRTVDLGHLSPAAMNLFFHAPLITKGFMHWARYGPQVFTLNIETEIFTETPAPIPQDVLSLKLNGGQNNYFDMYLSMGRYLSLLIARGEFVWDVWELKSETGEWRKVCNIALEGSFELKHVVDLLPLGWLKYLEVLIFSSRESRRTFFFYNLLTQKLDSVERLLSPPWSPSEFRNCKLIVHKNSLCWFDGC